MLTVFEEMNVHETLHTIVFGESILNDGVAVVLYRITVALAYEVCVWGCVGFQSDGRGFTPPCRQQTNVTGLPLDVGASFGKGVGSFIVVFFGGMLIGAVAGLLAALVTRYLIPESGRVMEPYIILLIGYLSYMLCEVLILSGIVA